MKRWLTSLWLAGCLGAAGCSKKEEPPPHPAEALPAADTEAAPALPSSPPPGTLPREGEAAAKPPVHEVLPADSGTPAPAPAGGPGAAPAGASGAVPEDPKNREWTARTVELKRTLDTSATLRSVRAGKHGDFDRVVFEFEGTQLPGYHLAYIDKPIIQCGSGDATPVAGQGWLEVRMTPARGHNDQGQATVAEREMKPGLPVILELERTCDFEGEVTWVLGNKGPNKFRVMELKDPTRLVVDVQH